MFPIRVVHYFQMWGGGGEIVKLNPELGEKLSPVTDPEIYNLM